MTGAEILIQQFRHGRAEILPSIVHDRVVVVGRAKVPCLDFHKIVLHPCRTSHSKSNG